MYGTRSDQYGNHARRETYVAVSQSVTMVAPSPEPSVVGALQRLRTSLPAGASSGLGASLVLGAGRAIRFECKQQLLKIITKAII